MPVETVHLGRHRVAASVIRMSRIVELTPKALPEAHVAVRAMIERAFSTTEGRIAIDAAAGNGYMSAWLRERGFSVLPFDISPKGFRAEGIECAAADLNAKIPVPDETSDLTVSIETIEHLENPFQFLREIARVTKPNGMVVITTPNVHFVRSRLKALFTGISTYFEFVEKDPWGQHIMPFSLGQILYAFNRDGLELLSVDAVGPRPRSLSRAILETANAATFVGALALRTKRRQYRDHYMNRVSAHDLWNVGRGEILVVSARKPGG